MPAHGPILALESSCDETAAAVVGADGTIHSNCVLSQLADHRPFGGVVPEIAARAHLHYLDSLAARAVAESGLGWAELAGVAATAGPGLIGGLLVGVMTGRGLADALGVDFYPVNHLAGHALTPRLTDGLDFPYTLLLVSGGHCQLVRVAGPAAFAVLGQSQDDAVGEAFDKVAKLLGLGYPGGPAVEAAAAQGSAGRFTLPRPLLGRNDCQFSFAGLKTAVQRQVSRLGDAEALDAATRCDLAAEFQAAVADVLADRCRRALESAGPGEALVAAGGVAANRAIRARLAGLCAERSFVAPPLALCTDQAAMIAWAAQERRAALGREEAARPVAPRPRWPLDEEPDT